MNFQDVANKGARKLEEELDLKAMGIEPPKKADHKTIEAAVKLYLDDMAQLGIKDPSKARRMLTRLREYANGNLREIVESIREREWDAVVFGGVLRDLTVAAQSRQ